MAAPRPVQPASGAVAVAATLEMMNRIVDALGLPINAATRAVARDLGLPELAGD